MRSGIDDPTVLEEDPASFLALVGAADVAADEAGRLLGGAVAGTRRAGLSWEVIGQVLGVSRQGAQQRFGRVPDPAPAGAGPRTKVVTRAHAFNEMAILEGEGRDGYQLVSFGMGRLVLEDVGRPVEHLRVAFASREARRALEEDGWHEVGRWFPFTYLTRPVTAA